MGKSPISSSFCDFVFQFNLTQHVLQPTHIKGNILDLVLSNAKISIDNLAISSPCIHKFNTDHFFISFHPNTTYEFVVTKSSRYVFDYGRADLDGLCSYLLDVDFSSCLCSTNIEFVWEKLKLIIHTWP